MAGAREQMIDAAERLAVERGLGAMSLREVQAASGQRNKSAAQYHFGSREGLIEAVIAARMGPVNERRLGLLAELPANPPLRAVVAALVDPLVEATAVPGSRWARFLFQGWADPTVAAVVRRSLDASSYRTVRALLADALHDLPPAVRARRVDQAVGLTVMSLAVGETAAETGGRLLATAVRSAELVDVCCGLLTAPVTATPDRSPEPELEPAALAPGRA